MGQIKNIKLHIVTDIKILNSRVKCSKVIIKMTKCAEVRGKPKSGRVWKSQGKKKSTIIKVKSLHKSWAVRTKERAEQQSIKNYERELKEAADLEKEQKRQRAAEQKKRREENALKSEIVQNIKSTAKIKRMKKKQLRQLQKR